MKHWLVMTIILALACCTTAHAAEEVPTFHTIPADLLPRLMNVVQAGEIFKEDLSNAVYEEGGWAFEDGDLVAKGKGDIWTKERYGNFMLALEFKCEKDTNSGVFIRCGSIEDWLHSCIEVQILQNNEDYRNDKHHCGGIFDCLAPAKQMVKEPGEWNQYIILARDNFIYVLLNGTQVIGMDLDEWTEPRRNPDGTRNKFKNAYKDMPREGHIGLQYHGQAVSFRNLRVAPLD